jgi:hypothetical protein
LMNLICKVLAGDCITCKLILYLLEFSMDCDEVLVLVARKMAFDGFKTTTTCSLTIYLNRKIN